MNIKVNTTRDAALLVASTKAPFEFQIPDDRDATKFINGVNYYLKLWGWWAQMSDAKRNKPTIYVAEKGKVK